MIEKTADDVRTFVRERYGKIAVSAAGEGCGCGPSCGEEKFPPKAAASLALGYSPEELAAAPEGSNLGLGCGNPQAIASLKAGETVLDLGSGAGLDSFLAARQVGQTGRVIGVDMTPEMIDKARRNAKNAGHANVEFRLGEIENLPVPDKSVDVIISNCVVNLSPEKERVYREAYRVLKPGGRLAISDVVASAPVPAEIKDDIVLHTGCLAAASTLGELETTLAEAGFTDLRIKPKDESRTFIRKWSPDGKIADYFLSASIEAVKSA